MNRCQSVGNPRNRVRFAGACGVLNQIIGADTILSDIRKNLFHYIVLVVTRENHLFLNDSLADTVFDDFFFFFYEGNKTVDQVEQAVTLQHFFPQITCGISVRVGRIARTASIASTIGALVKR